MNISFQDDKHLHSENQKWKLPPNGQPICLFSGNPTQTRTIIRPDDDSECNILCFNVNCLTFKREVTFSYLNIPLIHKGKKDFD